MARSIYLMKDGAAVPCSASLFDDRTVAEYAHHTRLELVPWVSRISGETSRGCRNFLIDGKVWGRVWMEQHGSRGASFTVQDVTHEDVREPALGKDGKPIIRTISTYPYNIGDPIMITAKAATLAGVPALIARLYHAGRIPDPDDIAAREAADAKARDERAQALQRAHEEAHRKLALAIDTLTQANAEALREGYRPRPGFAYALAVLRHLARTGEFTTDTTLSAEDLAP